MSTKKVNLLFVILVLSMLIGFVAFSAVWLGRIH
jgi:hypothetical protein